MQDRLTALREKVVTSATEALAAIETKAAEDRVKAKADLAKMMSKLKGTGLEAKAKELLASLQG
jgi:hypothetical protein